MEDVIQDPTFPLIETPKAFKARRQTTFHLIHDGDEITLFEAEGAGCVRHLWLTTATSGRGIRLRVHADGAPSPQVDMELNHFFGILLGKDPYRVESPCVSVVPQIGYNCYFPIPFSSSCRISLHIHDLQGKLIPREQRLVDEKPEESGLYCQIDWQQYPIDQPLTPYRLYSLFRGENPASSKGSFMVADVEGRGFVAGMFKAIKRLDHSDLLYHTGGSTWLIDGETEPNAIRGYNEEDDFGFSFGLFNYQSKWIGSPVAEPGGPFAEETVAWRIFGPDPVPFNSSLRIDFGCRADRTESVLYYYKIPDTAATPVVSPSEWKISAPFGCLDYQDFSREETNDEIESAAIQITAVSQRGWIDVRHLLRASSELWQDAAKAYIAQDRTFGSASDRLPVGFSVYASCAVASNSEKKAVLRFGFDDWLTLWVNNRRITTVRHDSGFEIARIPVSFVAGENAIRIKLNNANNREYRLWAFHCAVESHPQKA